jgi:glyoxylase-like metal-dependent hydrolase (beta-lactamase superfamily II)
LSSGRGAEVVLWLPARRSLVFGDVLLGAGSNRVGLCPESWLPDGTTVADLRLALRPLLELPVERLLVSHGEPVLRDGAAALRQALAG